MTNQKVFNVLSSINKHSKKIVTFVPLIVGLLSGGIKFIICKAFQCALGYFLSGFMISAIVVSLLAAVLKQVCEKHFRDCKKDIVTPEIEQQNTNNTLKNNNDLEVK